MRCTGAAPDQSYTQKELAWAGFFGDCSKIITTLLSLFQLYGFCHECGIAIFGRQLTEYNVEAIGDAVSRGRNSRYKARFLSNQRLLIYHSNVDVWRQLTLPGISAALRSLSIGLLRYFSTEGEEFERVLIEINLYRSQSHASGLFLSFLIFRCFSFFLSGADVVSVAQARAKHSSDAILSYCTFVARQNTPEQAMLPLLVPQARESWILQGLFRQQDKLRQ